MGQVHTPKVFIMKDLFRFSLILLSFILAACSEKTAPVALTAPTDVNIVNYGASSALITWTNTTTAASGITIERSEDAVTYKSVGTLGKTETSFIDKRLADGKEYHYRIYAFSKNSKSSYAEKSFTFNAFLAAPESLTAELGPDGVVLTWVDKCQGEDGYVLSKKTDTADMKDWKFLDANTESFVDEGAVSGEFEYTLQAYSGSMRSEAVTVSLVNKYAPVISNMKPVASSYMVSVDFVLADDGGEMCSAGICWSEGKSEPTIYDDVYVWSSTASTGKSLYGNAENLEYGKKYNVRAWARNSAGITYSPRMVVELEAEPKPINVEWTPVDEYAFPEEVRLYKGSVALSGGNANLWYAVADLSTGNVELYADKASSLTTVGQYVRDNSAREEFYVMVNGGYFDSKAQSYSYVAKRGTRLASNLKSLTRVKSYYVTRGAFGVDSNQKPSIHWVYENGAATWAYDRPLPVVNGEKVLSPTASYPSAAMIWDNYSGMGGGPVLLKNGRICFDHQLTADVRYKTNYELLQDDIFGPRVRPPRTVIGYTADGKVVIMVCDGRGAGGSNGATLTEMAMLMKGVGCTDVLNLDGGGSSVICAREDGEALNSPSDGSQRKVVSYIGFVRRK